MPAKAGADEVYVSSIDPHYRQLSDLYARDVLRWVARI
jgi:hypothetical protein